MVSRCFAIFDRHKQVQIQNWWRLQFDSTLGVYRIQGPDEADIALLQLELEVCLH